MASQELYQSVSDQLEAAHERLTAAIGDLDWEGAAANAMAIVELAKVLTSIFAELETPEDELVGD